ncbi:MAG: glycosyl transferase family 51, partial [Nitrospirota bacterium]|nr:glycosyl transferase family 51 [Nitrospirota bacterium]
WFATDLQDVCAALNSKGKSPQDEQARAEAYKKVMALFLSVKAPTNYLVKKPELLQERVDHFTVLMLKEGEISREFHDLIKAAPLKFRTGVFTAPRTAFIDNKASDAIRFHLLKILGLPDFYDLDRLDMTVNTTLDSETQKKVIRMLKQLGTQEYVASSGLYGDRMLKKGDPEDLIYSLVLYEKTPAGNELRVQADNMDKPFNFNEGVKLDLGSTAKLRTLVHYLMIVHETFDVLSMKDPETLENNPSLNKDPITRWVVEQIRQNPGLTSTQIMEAAMERKFSGNPSEAFFTGGGLHRFENFNKEDNGKVMPLSEGLKNSVNLVFVRLMREIVHFHIARLGIDSKAVLDDRDHAKRMELLKIIVDKESRRELSMFAKRYRDLTPDQAVGKLLGKRSTSLRHLALLFYATHPSASAEDLDIWLRQRKPEAPGITKKVVADLDKKYGRLTMSDYGYLLSINPVEIWTAGYLADHPKAKWDELVQSSSGIREKTGEWLLNKRNKRAQDIRLNILLEEMAFKEIHKGWKKVGYPFEYLVPSYATSIGSSADRPVALAELMGIIMNDGMSMPVIKVRSVNFAARTPYETELFLNRVKGERVMPVEVARTARKALAGVVEGGTARRVYGAYTGPDGSPLVIGGKTGSGDNRFETFGKDGRVISSRVVNRTATFVFYIGDRYFGVITAFMPGEKAADYSFTSSLPVQIMRLLAPDLNPLVLSDTKT